MRNQEHISRKLLQSYPEVVTISLKSLVRIKKLLSMTPRSQDTCDHRAWPRGCMLTTLSLSLAKWRTCVIRARLMMSLSKMSPHQFHRAYVATGQCPPKPIKHTSYFKHNCFVHFRKDPAICRQIINNKPGQRNHTPTNCVTIAPVPITLTQT